MREKAVHDVEVRATHLWKDGGMVREKWKNRATEIAIETATECGLLRELGGAEGRERERKRERDLNNYYHEQIYPL